MTSPILSLIWKSKETMGGKSKLAKDAEVLVLVALSAEQSCCHNDPSAWADFHGLEVRLVSRT